MTFQEALPRLIELVGGWDAKEYWPWDLGGPSRAGIHQAAYNHQCGYIPRDGPRLVDDIDAADISEFYWHRWHEEKIGAIIVLTEALADPISFVFFQLNYLGRAQALELLQNCLNVPASGNFDESTQAAFLQANQFPKQLARSLLSAQLAYHTFNPIPEPYQARRLARVHGVHSMLGSATQP